MLKSMTGFGRFEEIIGGRDILVEIRSVNHRYYEFSSRVPRNYGYLDEKLKNCIKERVSRGKIEAAVSIYAAEGADAGVRVNRQAAERCLSELRSANEALGLEDNIKLSDLLRFPDIFIVKNDDEDEDEVWNSVRSVTLKALDKFISMRETEGERMKADFEGRLVRIEELVGNIEQRSPSVNEEYRQRLYTKLCDILEDKDIDEQRILTEAAIFADKTAVDEETVRLRSHIAQFRKLIELDEPVGRKLDFLIQEFNREANTIGSKAQDRQITSDVLDIKAEIEKLREQIQNVE
ncbi:MAG: YicC family protein [Oscillospiraceae bacterium]|nr:YicC family protein [Oscillospiraceae bacterium]